MFIEWSEFLYFMLYRLCGGGFFVLFCFVCLLVCMFVYMFLRWVGLDWLG